MTSGINYSCVILGRNVVVYLRVVFGKKIPADRLLKTRNKTTRRIHECWKYFSFYADIVKAPKLQYIGQLELRPAFMVLKPAEFRKSIKTVETARTGKIPFVQWLLLFVTVILHRCFLEHLTSQARRSRSCNLQKITTINPIC